MKKRLIFDIDNTLIIWEKDYIKGLEKTLEHFGIESKKYSKTIDNIIESLENKYTKLSKQALLEDINNTCNLNLDESFIKLLFKNQGTLAKKDENVIETIKYLSQKYELVILTNYFKEIQEARLETAGIRKYFKEIYAGDEVSVKPNKEAFKTAIGNHKKEECLMIGDSISHDIEGAKSIGLDVIAVDYFGKLNKNLDCPIITNINELTQIL